VACTPSFQQASYTDGGKNDKEWCEEAAGSSSRVGGLVVLKPVGAGPRDDQEHDTEGLEENR
jgi:hypothetical protein